ncbi:unnamed protein product, partial [Mesorhabditis belari]|uniref:Uncharacterized protein n=1 Tax=Mesorhabditis belari TaxID=2138241 RepID=A0AAF3JAT4_9BILA
MATFLSLFLVISISILHVQGEQTVAIRGVFLCDGNPLEGVRVSIYHGGSQTVAVRGVFLCDGNPLEGVRVSIYHGGYLESRPVPGSKAIAFTDSNGRVSVTRTYSPPNIPFFDDFQPVVAIDHKCNVQFCRLRLKVHVGKEWVSDGPTTDKVFVIEPMELYVRRRNEERICTRRLFNENAENSMIFPFNASQLSNFSMKSK